MDRSHQFWDRIATGYSKQPIADEASDKKTAADSGILAARHERVGIRLWNRFDGDSPFTVRRAYHRHRRVVENDRDRYGKSRHGVFVSSTACLGGTALRFIKYIAPIGRFFGLLPLVRVFTPEELEESIVKAGFSIDHRWQPDRGRAVFIVAEKAG